jgi:DNA-binding transcriptional LysR family regulator
VVSTFSCVPALLLRTEAVAVMPSRYVAGLIAEDERLETAPLQMKLPQLSYVLLWHERSDRRPSHRWARVAIEQIAREKMCG